MSPWIGIRFPGNGASVSVMTSNVSDLENAFRAGVRHRRMCDAIRRRLSCSGMRDRQLFCMVAISRLYIGRPLFFDSVMY